MSRYVFIFLLLVLIWFYFHDMKALAQDMVATFSSFFPPPYVLVEDILHRLLWWNIKFGLLKRLHFKGLARWLPFEWSCVGRLLHIWWILGVRWGNFLTHVYKFVSTKPSACINLSGHFFFHDPQWVMKNLWLRVHHHCCPCTFHSRLMSISNMFSKISRVSLLGRVKWFWW